MAAIWASNLVCVFGEALAVSRGGGTGGELLGRHDAGGCLCSDFFAIEHDKILHKQKVCYCYLGSGFLLISSLADRGFVRTRGEIPVVVPFLFVLQVTAPGH